MQYKDSVFMLKDGILIQKKQVVNGFEWPGKQFVSQAGGGIVFKFGFIGGQDWLCVYNIRSKIC